MGFGAQEAFPASWAPLLFLFRPDCQVRRLNHAARFSARTGAYPMAHAEDFMHARRSLPGAGGQNFRPNKKTPRSFRMRGVSVSFRYYMEPTPASGPACSSAPLSAGPYEFVPMWSDKRANGGTDPVRVRFCGHRVRMRGLLCTVVGLLLDSVNMNSLRGGRFSVKPENAMARRFFCRSRTSQRPEWWPPEDRTERADRPAAAGPHRSAARWREAA